MSLKWETELREPIEDDESEDAFQPDEGEDDLLGFCACASEPCLGDWLNPAF